MLYLNEVMPLDEARRARVMDWLMHRCPDFRCPACRQKDWSVCGITDPGGLPLVCVGCHSCGYVAHFCAVMLGIASPDADER
jgi:hypothetical protein